MSQHTKLVNLLQGEGEGDIPPLDSMEAVRPTAARSLAAPARTPYPLSTPHLVLIRLAPSTRVPPVVTSCLAQKSNALRPTRTN